MSKTRDEFQYFLEDFMGNKPIHEHYQNVYFNPPEDRDMNYPCIVYNLADIQVTHADNRSYRKCNRYQIIYITENPGDPKVQELEDLPMCTFDRHYTADNMHHYAYTIFF